MADEKKSRFVFAPVADVKTGETDFNAPHMKTKMIEEWHPKPVNPWYAMGQDAAKNPAGNTDKYNNLGKIRRALPTPEAIAKAMVEDMIARGARVAPDKKK